MEKIAILWDLENLHSNIFPSRELNKFFKQKGEIRVRRAFADWRLQKPNTATDLIEKNYELLHIPHTKTEKNSVDMYIAAVSISLVQEYEQITSFVFVTSDYDFRPIFTKLKSKGKKIYLVSDSTKVIRSKIENMVDGYFDFNEIIKSNSAKEKALATKIEGVKDFRTKTRTLVELYPNVILKILDCLIQCKITEKKEEINFLGFENRLQVYDLVNDSVQEQLIQNLEIIETDWLISIIKYLEIFELLELRSRNKNRYIYLTEHGKKVAENQNLEILLSRIATKSNPKESTSGIKKETIPEVETELGTTKIEKNDTKVQYTEDQKNKLKKQYFGHMEEVLKEANHKELLIWQFAKLLKLKTKINYKDLGFGKLIKAVKEATFGSRIVAKRTEDKKNWIVQLEK